MSRYTITIEPADPDAATAVIQVTKISSAVFEVTSQETRPGGADAEPDPDLLDQVLAGLRQPVAAIGMPVTRLGLSTRITNALQRKGVHTVDQLLGWSDVDLMDIQPLGLGSVAAIADALAERGWRLRTYRLGQAPAPRFPA